jgi:ABC-type transport system involved in multi-copper enzyme maturation permease subunit
MLLCTFPLFSRRGEFLYFLFQFGLLLGVPFLACHSFGNEFRHKTMDLLVSQPVNRLKIWREKWIVVAIAFLTTTLFASLTSRTPWHITRIDEMDFVMFLVVTTCSATFWTLVGRSTLGGLVLNISSFILLFSIKASLWVWNSTAAILALSAATLGYSAVMLWLGRRVLVHRQSGEGFAGPDVMATIPSVMPARIASWFQCRPDQVLLNLIRRDLRLLRPLWLLTVLYVLGWSVMATSFSFVPAVGEMYRTALVILVLVTATYPIIAIFLAASLPMGEERAFGVQLWHLALPLSMKTQWLIRLLSGLTAVVLCAVAVPALLMALAQALLRPEFMEKFESMGMIEPIPALLAFFLVSFWCAVVARDLIRTAGLIAATGGMMFLAAHSSLWITERLIDLLEYLLILPVSWYHLNPYIYTFYEPLNWFPNLSRLPEWISMTVLSVLMTIHTMRLFRRLPQENALKMLRSLVPYLVLIITFVSLMTIRSWNGGYGVVPYELFYETEKAIVKLQPTNTFTVEDLAKASVLPASTQRWLRNSKMEVTISDPPAGNFLPPGYERKIYNLTLHLASGTTCKTSFPFYPDRQVMFLSNPAKCD